jgi:glycosyltransferase involved in cell wall biosynthesis
MKIVHCIFSLETGGAEVLAVGLLNEICLTHEVSLIIINNKYSDALLKQLDNKVRVYFINRKPGSRNFLKLIKLNFLLWQLKPDVLHSHDPNVANVIKVKAGKLLHTVHDVGIPFSEYHSYDKVIAISGAVYVDVVSKGNFPVKKIYNGIPVHLFKQRKAYKLTATEPVKLVQVSRLIHEKKGQDVLLHALHKVRYEYGFQNFSLDFMGSGASEPYLKNLVLHLGLEKQVRFIGEKNREWLYNNLCNYHCLVQPSRYEGFGLTIIEGFAAGLPVIASDIDGPSEIMNELAAGFLFKNGNAANCAESVCKLFSIYRDNHVDKLMQQTLPLVFKKYSLNSCAAQYMEEYNMLLGS